MPQYLFECPCGDILSTVRSMTDDTLSKYHDACGLEARRLWTSFVFHRYVEHVSPATGQPVSSHKQFREQLKVASEEQTARTGIPCDYQPVDMTDPDSLGVTGDGLDAQMRKHRELGTPLGMRKKSFL